MLILGYLIGLVIFGAEMIMGISSKRRRARLNWKLLRNAWHQVEMMRFMQKNEKKNPKKKNSVKWKLPKKANKKKEPTLN